MADARSARDGSFVEQLGHYNPMTDPSTIVVDEEKTREWLSKGAQPSEAVRRILTRMGMLEKVYKQ